MKHSLIKSIAVVTIMIVTMASQAQMMPGPQMQQRPQMAPPQFQQQMPPRPQMQPPQMAPPQQQPTQFQQQSQQPTQIQQPQFQQQQPQPALSQSQQQQPQSAPSQMQQQQPQTAPSQTQPQQQTQVSEPLQMNWSSLVCIQDTPTSVKNYFVRDFEGNIYQMNSQQWNCEQQAGIKKFQTANCLCVLKTGEASATDAAGVTVVDNTQREAQRFDEANAGVFERIDQNVDGRQDNRDQRQDLRQDTRDQRQDLRQDQRQQERR